MSAPEEVHLMLLPSPAGEPDAGRQDELRRFYSQLLDANIDAVPRWEGDTVCRSFSVHNSELFKLLGEFAVPLGQVVSSALAAAVTAWFTRRTGRKVRMKVGDVEVEAGTIEELELLWQRAHAIKVSQEEKNHDEA
jgi:hypothetical protein